MAINQVDSLSKVDKEFGKSQAVCLIAKKMVCYEHLDGPGE